MTELRRPDNKQMATVIHVTPARIALDTSCITPARRWWTLAELAAVNDSATIAQACKTPESAPYRPAWEVNPYAIVMYVPPPPLVVRIPRDMLGHIREALYCAIKAA